MIDRPEGRRIRKILMTTDAVGGVWTYGVDLAESLSARGVEVVLAVVGPPPNAAQRAQTCCRIIETGLTLDWMAASPAAARSSARELAALSRRVRPDVTHLNGPTMAIGGDFGAPVLGVCHSCLPTWWAAVKGCETLPNDLAWRRDLQAEGMAVCDDLIAPSRAFAAATFEVYGWDSKVVRNGRRPVVAIPADAGAAVFTAGRLWDEGKNLAALNEAAALSGLEIEAAGPLVGPGGERVRLPELLTPGSLSSDQVRARLAARPIFASTALYEPFGLAVLEAAQAGCALVLSDIPIFRELWSGAARFVDPRDPARIAEALTTLSRDRAERRRLGAAAQARAARYTLEATTQAMMNAYRDIVGFAAEVSA